MLLDEIKARLLAARKAGRDVEKEVLRVALGDVQTAEARKGQAATDQEVASILRKLLKSNEETLAATTDPAQQAALREENTVLTELLPRTLSADEIVAALAPVADAVRSAGNDGQATGVAMKHLRSAGAPVTGQDVAQAVRTMRS